jgi:hypothetical protein
MLATLATSATSAAFSLVALHYVASTLLDARRAERQRVADAVRAERLHRLAAELSAAYPAPSEIGAR